MAVGGGGVTDVLRPPIHFLTQSRDPISCYRKPMERTNETISRSILLIRSNRFPKQLVGSHDWVRKWIRAITDTVL